MINELPTLRMLVRNCRWVVSTPLGIPVVPSMEEEIDVNDV